MRLTVVQYKKYLEKGLNYTFLRKQIWRTRGLLKEPHLVVPQYLQGTDVKIEDPLEWGKDEHPEWEPPVKDDPRFMSPLPDVEHPDYHDRQQLQFNSHCRLLEGVNQACILTKTQPFFHLPQSMADLIGATEIANQDELVQRYIMQANIWDSTKEKLPKRFNPQLPGWKFKAEWGIPWWKRCRILQQNLLRLCQSLHGKFPDLAATRRLVTDLCISMTYCFQGDKDIGVKAMHEWMLTTNRPLPPFARGEEVDKTVTHTLPDLFPVSPLIDLQPLHIYKVENNTGWSAEASHSLPHTIFVEDRNRWNSSQRNAKYLMYCFAHCLALAKHKYGWDVKTLPEPITTQCIGTNGEMFSFVCFQLNTCNLDSSAGIKNMAWFDNDNVMYNKILPKRAMLRNTKYEDYDPEVFKKFLAFYVNGAELFQR